LTPESAKRILREGQADAVSFGKAYIANPDLLQRLEQGLPLNEQDKEERAIEFYNLLSSFDYMASTPTLFNSGTLRPQLSSCY
ncbi:ribonucleotide reductase N-terminal alpha domain-containing protein, partial [Acinetobacter nosocomialis]|uniref:ribonucleotide reductase N-terminal alpha domain-containing protein n=1 Tax=Acinetobacter nosocomialis TaxID=106654 RepID=UPI0023EE30D6